MVDHIDPESARTLRALVELHGLERILAALAETYGPAALRRLVAKL
jgi:hypothetical protein